MRADEEHAERAEAVVRHERVLFEGLGRDGGGLRRVARVDRHHARDRRAVRGRDRAREDADPALPRARRRGRGGLPPPARLRGAARALRRPAAGGRGRAARDGAGRDREDGLLGLLPDRLGLRQVREGQRDRGGSRTWLGRRLDRVLRAADHRRRPARVRPAVRAVPERRAHLDAGYRHRLLGEGPRPRDPVRRRQVRPRVGRADRHLRPDVPARGHARRRARAGPRLRRRRPDRQADPRADHGPVEELRRVPRRRARPPARLRLGAGGAADHRRRARPRGDRPQLLDPRGRGRDRRPAADGHRRRSRWRTTGSSPSTR